MKTLKLIAIAFVLIASSSTMAKGFREASIVGSWLCTGVSGTPTEGLLFLTNFNFGGTFSIDANIQGLSGVHGTFRRTGLFTFESIDQGFLFDASGFAGSIQTVNANFKIIEANRMIVDVDGIVQTLDGTTVQQFTAQNDCERMVIGNPPLVPRQ